MNVKLFGDRCLVEYLQRPITTSKIIIPDTAQKRDTHRFGTVRFIGDGRVKKKDCAEKQVASLVAPGDVVMFQINEIMEATQKFVIDGKTYMNLLQGELIARVTGEDVCVENLEMLGEFVLLKWFMRRPPGSTLFVPEGALRHSAPDFIYFRCLKKGSRATVSVNVGDEVIVNFGRLTPMFIIKMQNGISENEEYAYTLNDWVDGVVEAKTELDPNGCDPNGVEAVKA